MPTASKRPYYQQLDGLRAVAILLVIVAHELLETNARRLGELGVLLFFVLSGFLITTLLCNEESKTGRIALGAFYVRRALRILPAMYTLLGVTALLVAGGYITDVKWSSFVAAALYVRNLFGKGNTLDHMWSLSLEEQFYLSWPFMLMVTPKPVRLTMALACIGVVVAWRAAAISLHLFDYNLGIYYIRTDFRFDSILAGCALALAHRGTKFLAWVRFTPPLVLLAALLLTVRHPRGSYAYELTFQTALTTALVARLVMVDSDAFARLLSTPPLRWVGRLSYSWYLWQEMFLVTRTPSWGMVRQFPLNIVASLGAAMASYYIVERPFLRWKDVIASRKLRGPVAPVAFGANGGLCASDAPRNQVP